MYCGRSGPENGGCLSVCVSVCVSVCLCRAVWRNYWADFNQTYTNWSRIDLVEFEFWLICKIDDVTAAILYAGRVDKC